MLLRKEQGGTSVGPYTWEHDGDVADVDDKTGAELLAIKGGGYSHVAEMPEPEPQTPEPPAANSSEPPAATEPETPAEPEAPAKPADGE